MNWYWFFTYSMVVVHTFVGLILIGVILLQRGRGGGLAGAFGGLGGQSAFGNRAGDVFTKITIILATIWIVLGCVCVLLASGTKGMTEKFQSGTKAGIKSAEEEEGKGEAGDAKGADTKADDLLPGPGPENPPGTDAKSDAKTDAEAPKGDAKSDPKSDAKDDAAKPKEDAEKPKEDAAKPKEEPAKPDAKADPKAEPKADSKDAPAANPDPAKKDDPAPAKETDKKPD